MFIPLHRIFRRFYDQIRLAITDPAMQSKIDSFRIRYLNDCSFTEQDMRYYNIISEKCQKILGDVYGENWHFYITLEIRHTKGQFILHSFNCIHDIRGTLHLQHKDDNKVNVTFPQSLFSKEYLYNSNSGLAINPSWQSFQIMEDVTVAYANWPIRLFDKLFYSSKKGSFISDNIIGQIILPSKMSPLEKNLLTLFDEGETTVHYPNQTVMINYYEPYEQTSLYPEIKNKSAEKV